MNTVDSWHNQDAFWELFGPILFDPSRLAAAPAEVEKIVKLLSIEERATVLDLACGPGRHSLEFARRGCAVTGVDRTATFIEQARAEAAQRGLNVTFVLDDMRDVRAPDSFDVIVNLFGSFGYFENADDDRQVVRNMHASLRAGGRFLIETAGKEIVAGHFREREWSEVGDLLILSEKKASQHWRRIETRWIVIQGAQRFEHRVSVRSYSAVELSSLLLECGFGDVRVYGSLDGTEYDQAAQRLVVVGQK
jgi:SAM-dependent methyltransferase